MAPSTKPRKNLRIGVDVGGTNTDGVLLDPSTGRILAWHKTPTTAPDPSEGIAATIRHLLDASSTEGRRSISPHGDVASVTVGTTAFVNAVVERDATRLERVAVLRLCGPFSKHVPPCVDWPAELRGLVLGYHALVKGGLEVDGGLIGDVDEGEIVEVFCKEVKARGIRAVVVDGVFSPIDVAERQEERAAEVVRRELGPGCDVVCSMEVANLGFLERENAAILNAAILRYARRTIRSFRRPVRELGMTCPVFVTQNDGTILSGDMAARLPIRTFSSGPTNSMRGAAFLIQGQGQGQRGDEGSEGEAMMVVDIGGTTTDVGLLLPNGFPRQQAAYSELAGVRMVGLIPQLARTSLRCLANITPLTRTSPVRISRASVLVADPL
jgi:N-methylhydantoinase A/oxoprolinase/acetone carboxylase beta subunit